MHADVDFALLTYLLFTYLVTHMVTYLLTYLLTCNSIKYSTYTTEYSASKNIDSYNPTDK